MLARSRASEPQFSTQVDKYIANCGPRADDGTTKAGGLAFFSCGCGLSRVLFCSFSATVPLNLIRFTLFKKFLGNRAQSKR